MSPRKNSLSPLKILSHIKKSDGGERKIVNTASPDPQLTLLRAWQTKRLKETYTYFYNDPQYLPAIEFFLKDIYAPRDFSQRDADFEQLHNFFSKILPASMIKILTNAIKLNELTDSLDHKLLRALVEDLGMEDEITPQLYAEGYQVCDNYEERAQQIELIVALLYQAWEGARIPLIGPSLRLAKRPTYAAGWSELYDFLERGYKAAKKMHDVSTMADTIYEREMRILDQIFAGEPHPFNL
jgi:hypothetical protein